jgi:hypothetical protein
MGTAQSSFLSLDIRNVPPDSFYEMICVPFIKCAYDNGIKFDAQIKVSKNDNETKLAIPGGGYVKFTHLYRVNSEVFKQDQGGIQIFAGGTGISFEQMEGALRAFSNLGIVSCNLVEQKSGGCYVATAVYGSYDCPQVWTLRRYRDNSLRNTWYGDPLIKMYYTISPLIVKSFGRTKWFQLYCRKYLDKFIARLQNEGYESKPYWD